MTKEQQIIDQLQELFDMEIDFHKKVHEYFNETKVKEDYYSTKEYLFFEIADMINGTGTMCNALSLLRDLRTKIEEENE